MFSSCVQHWHSCISYGIIAHMMMKKNDILPITVQRHTQDGQGIAQLPDGRICFVAGALAGERGQMRLLKLGKSVAWGRMEQRENDSLARIVSDCPYYPTCGGCQTRHMSYEAECEAKQQHVADVLARIGGYAGLDFEIIGADYTARYRNKAIFPVGGTVEQPHIGFYRGRSHDVVDVADCLLQHPSTALVRQTVLDWIRRFRIAPYNEARHKGFLRHILMRSNRQGEMLVCLLGNGGELPHAAALCQMMAEAVPKLVGVVFGENRRKDNVILGERFTTLYGQAELRETLCGAQYRIGVNSFFQINPAQTELLYAKAAEYAQLSGRETVLDLYCGIGSIGLSMAQGAKRLIGVEIIEQAVENARENAESNGVDNASFFCGDAGDIAARFAASGEAPDVIIFDPPRKGLSQQAIDAALSMQPQRMVYVSCDPATFARDVKLFHTQGYALQKLCAVDLFPRTKHVECVGLLERV